MDSEAVNELSGPQLPQLYSGRTDSKGHMVLLHHISSNAQAYLKNNNHKYPSRF